MYTDTERESSISLSALTAVLIVLLLAWLVYPGDAWAQESDSTTGNGAPPFCATAENGPPFEVGPPDGTGPGNAAALNRPNPGAPFIAVRATAAVTGTWLREVTSAQRGGATFATYAADHGVTETELANAIVESMKALRAEMIAQFGADGLEAPDPDDVTAQRVAELVHVTGFGPVGPCEAARSE